METADIILGTSQWALVAALLFSLRRDRMEWTAAITAIALTVMAVTFLCMKFWNAGAACAAAALCWYVLTLRHWRVAKLVPMAIRAIKGRPLRRSVIERATVRHWYENN